MSDTPRTENEIEHAENVALYLQCQQTEKWPHGSEVVRAEFARELERELAEAKEQLDYAKRELGTKHDG